VRCKLDYCIGRRDGKGIGGLWTYHWEDDSARIFDADAESLEDFDFGVVSVATVYN
jgi:hypothetical protein